MKKEKYSIYKKDYNGEITLNIEKDGYHFNPKNTIDYGLEINEIIVIKSSLIEKIIKKKIKNKLDLYLQLLIEKLDGDESDDSRRALGDLQRYRLVVNKKYGFYLDNKYLELLNKKFDVIEREFKSNIIYDDLELEEAHKSR